MSTPIPVKHPLVSICIPAYTAEHVLPETLASAQNQSWPHLEIVICVDPSEDNTLALCRAEASKDSRIRVYENAERLGWAGNTKNVIGRSRGEFWSLLPQDDLLTPDFLSEAWYWLQKSGADFSYTDKAVFSGLKTSGRQFLPDYDLPDPRSRLLTYYRDVATPSFWMGLFARRVFDTLEFPTHPYNFPALDNLWANRVLLNFRGKGIAKALNRKRSDEPRQHNCCWWWQNEAGREKNVENWESVKAQMLAETTGQLGEDTVLTDALELAIDVRCYRLEFLTDQIPLAQALYERWRPDPDAPDNSDTSLRWLMASRCSDALGDKPRALAGAIKAAAAQGAGEKAWQNLVWAFRRNDLPEQAAAALQEGRKRLPNNFLLEQLSTQSGASLVSPDSLRRFSFILNKPRSDPAGTIESIIATWHSG